MSAGRNSLLFAAHDPAAARLLLPVFRLAMASDYRVDLLAAGPAQAIWNEEGLSFLSEAPDLGAYDLLLTGTSFHADFDRALWGKAREAGIPSLAGLDAWINLKRRFLDEKSGELVLPDLVITIDEENRQALLAEGISTQSEIAGQPHLEAVVEKLRERRKSEKNVTPGLDPGVHVDGRVKPGHDENCHNTAIIAFFSEPIDSDFPDGSRGFEQFETAALLAESLFAHTPVQLVIQPHPREDIKTWKNRIAAPEGVALTIGGGRTDDLLAKADLVTGMTSMVLIEAGLAGIPTLSLQPNRKFSANPLVDRLGPPVLNANDLPLALKTALSATATPPPTEFSAACENAAARYLAVIATWVS
jgi:hypothetical protein